MQISNRELMPLVQDSLDCGQHVRLSVSGSSMLPHIKSGDIIELAPINSFLKKGDIVLAKSSIERYVLHRIVRIDRKGFFLRGDAQEEIEGPLAMKDILGRAISLKTASTSHCCSLSSWHKRLSASIWNYCYPYSGRLLRLCLTLYNRHGG